MTTFPVKLVEYEPTRMISVVCPYCNSRLNTHKFDGDSRKVRCKSCHKGFWIEKEGI